MNVAGGATDVTTYFAMRLAADGTGATGLDVTTFDLQYVRTGAAPSAKVDATALAATDSAHADNKAIEVDATDQPGLYRVDWPDAAFAAGVPEVILSVKCATCFTEHMAVEIDMPVVAESLDTQAKADVKALLYGQELQTGTAEAGTTAGTIVDTDISPDSEGPIYVGNIVLLTGGTSASKQVRRIATAQAGSFAVSPDFSPAPTTGETWTVFRGEPTNFIDLYTAIAAQLATSEIVDEGYLDAALVEVGGYSPAEIATAIWSKGISGFGQYTFGGFLNDLWYGNAVQLANQLHNAVWSATGVAYTSPGTMGYRMKNLDRSVTAVEANIRGADDDSLKSLSDQLDGISPAGAPTAQQVSAQVWADAPEGTELVYAGGAIPYTYTLTKQGVAAAIAGVQVYVSTDASGDVLVATGLTDNAGQVLFHLNAGTYYFWPRHPEYYFEKPAPQEVSEDA